MKREMSAEGCFGVAVAFLLFLVVSFIVNDWALSVLWKWFILPLGAPQLSIGSAIGLSIVVGFLTAKPQDSKKEVDWTTVVPSALLSPLIAVGIGWIVHLFVA